MLEAAPRSDRPRAPRPQNRGSHVAGPGSWAVQLGHAVGPCSGASQQSSRQVRRQIFAIATTIENYWRLRPHGCRGLRSGAADRPESPRTQLPLAALPTVTAANPQAEALRTSLNGRGQRLTPQRQRVLGLFERIGEGSHLSAEEVHQRLLKGDEKVSLATVYRTLRLLSSMQLLQELELPDGGRRFELAGDTNRDHHHLVCVRCGQTEEFESHDVLQAGERAAGLHGFRLLECVLNVRAVCPSCAQAEGA